MLRLNLAVLAMAILSSSFVANTTAAQAIDPRRQQRRDFLEDLLQGLLESQLNRPTDPRVEVRPGAPAGVTPKMQTARVHLKGLSEETGHLIRDLQYEQRHSAQLRPLLGDALKVKASSDVLLQRSSRYGDIAPLREDFRSFDRDWRVLAHRLGQVPSLSAKCRSCIERVNNYDSQLCGLFGIGPQINRQELMRLATAFSTNLQHLLQDVYYDMRGHSTTSLILKEGQALHARVNQASALIPHADYESIVRAYKSCAVGWRTFSHKIAGSPYERIRRDVRSIEQIGRQIHEQLWLPVEMDRTMIVKLIDSIQQDAHRALQAISFDRVLACQSPGALMAACREFRRQRESFRHAVDNHRPLDELTWDFRLFEVQWDDVDSHLRELNIPAVNRRLEEIQMTMSNLKLNFGDGPPVSHYSLQQILAELDQLTRQMSHEVHRKISAGRYDHAFHSQICGQSDRLRDSVRDLHQHVAATRNVAYRVASGPPAEFVTVFDQWKQLKPMIHNCRPEDRTELARYRGQIEPLMVKLQVIYAD